MKITLRVLCYLGPYRWLVVAAYVALFTALGLQLTIPWVLASVVDRGLVEGNRGYLWRGALAIVGLAALQGAFTYGRAYLVQRLAEQVGHDLRRDLYAHLQTLPFAFYDRAQTGQLMSRATDDINNIRGALMMGLRALVLAVATLIAVTVILFRLDALLAAVALSTMPLLVWWSIRFGVGVRPFFSRVQEQFGVMTSALQENIAGGRVVRAFAQEAQESARFERELDELFGRNIAAARRWSLAYPLMLLFSGLGLAGVLWLGGYRVLTGALSIGTLVAFNRYLVLLNEPARWMGFVVSRIARAIASARRIFEILDTKPAIADRPEAVALPQMHGEVVFEGVTFTYPGAKRPALEDVSFVARPGETIALLGPTGAGKTTLVNLLPRFYYVSAGHILIDSHDVRDIALTSLRAQIGSVLQETFLFGLTVRENIAYGRPDAPFEAVVAAAKAARADDFIRAMPEGYDTILGERGVTLSGGQKQRVAIARALLLDPAILVLDDATSSVDTETEAAIQAAMHTLMQGRTSFVIVQRLSSVRDADQILVLRDGRIVERGTHIQLLQRDGFYRELHDLQVRHRADTTAVTPADDLAPAANR
ncbi:MAG: ABC transporter ATP-binding protein/permease [Chloroflexota bacterium]|nr:ABC transporter ATP-binding protein/permease [Chloroflexota bacterium]